MVGAAENDLRICGLAEIRSIRLRTESSEPGCAMMNVIDVIRATQEQHYDEGDNVGRPSWDTYPHRRISGVEYNEVDYGVAIH